MFTRQESLFAAHPICLLFRTPAVTLAFVPSDGDASSLSHWSSLPFSASSPHITSQSLCLFGSARCLAAHKSFIFVAAFRIFNCSMRTLICSMLGIPFSDNQESNLASCIGRSSPADKPQNPELVLNK